MLDSTLTHHIQEYLALSPEARPIEDGALLLYRLTADRPLYLRALHQPTAYADIIAHELRKHLVIRLDGLTRQEVARLERQARPLIDQTIQAGPPSDTPDAPADPDDPAAPTIPSDAERPQTTQPHRGRRPDHAQLPKEIQQLYDANATIYFKMKSLYNRLLLMEDRLPCDRYELLRALRQADTQYRANWKSYDEYKVEV